MSEKRLKTKKSYSFSHRKQTYIWLIKNPNNKSHKIITFFINHYGC